MNPSTVTMKAHAHHRRRMKEKIIPLLAFLMILVPPLLIILANFFFPVKKAVPQRFDFGVSHATPPEPGVNSEINGKWYGLCAKNSIRSIEDFRKIVNKDHLLGEHFAGFDWDNARMGNLREALSIPVSYRNGEIYTTSRAVTLPKGDGFITDGKRWVRTYCCNDYEVDPAAPPVGMEVSPIKKKVDGPTASPLTEKVDSATRRREIVNGPPFQSSGSAPFQLSVAPPPPANTMAVAMVPAPLAAVAPPPPPPPPPPPVPEPGTFVLVGTCLAGLGLGRWIRCRRK